MQTKSLAIPAVVASLAGLGLDVMGNSLDHFWPSAPYLVWAAIFLCGSLMIAAYPLWLAWEFGIPFLRWAIQPLRTHRPQAIEEEQPKPARALSDGRIIVGVSPRFLMELYRRNTSFRAANLSKEYLGRWTEIDGLFEDVSSETRLFLPGDKLAEHDLPHRPIMTVTLTQKDDRHSPELISLYFDADRWGEYLTALIKGQRITVRCRIVKISKYHLIFDNCEIIDHQTKEVVGGAAAR